MHELIVHASLLDPTTYLAGTGGWFLVILAAMVFIETGLLFPFLPGDTLVFAAALLAPALGVSPVVVAIVAAAAAVAGDQVGFMIGRRFGRRLFRDDRRILSTKRLAQADEFFARYGAFALVLARFVPLVRTFVPPVVGASHMPYRRFAPWNIIGGVAWAVIITLAGLLLGKVSFVAHNLDLIAVAIAIVSLLPIVVSFMNERRRGHRTTAAMPRPDADNQSEIKRARTPGERER